MTKARRPEVADGQVVLLGQHWTANPFRVSGLVPFRRSHFGQLVLGGMVPFPWTSVYPSVKSLVASRFSQGVHRLSCPGPLRKGVDI